MDDPLRPFPHRLWCGGLSITNMKQLKHRDVEKTYPVGEFVTKLRRLADALESGRAFTLSVAGERRAFPPTPASTSNTNAKAPRRNWSFS